MRKCAFELLRGNWDLRICVCIFIFCAEFLTELVFEMVANSSCRKAESSADGFVLHV